MLLHTHRVLNVIDTGIYLHTYLPFNIRYITENKATDKKLTYMKDKSKICIEYTI